jgi:hypothetical protein
MKKTSILLVLAMFLFLPAFAVADSMEMSMEFSGGLDHDGAVGNWTIENGRLHQKDTEQRMAKINFQVPQKGLMEYRFDVHYEGGGIEDRMGGFGIHLFVDDPFARRSWGNGSSYLLWVNYDPEATYGKQGFVAQVYESTNAFTMELLPDYQMKMDTGMLSRDNLSLEIPVRITVNGNTGLVKVYDPRRENYYYKFRLPEAPKRGSHIALRTNSLAVSFDDLSVRSLD